VESRRYFAGSYTLAPAPGQAPHADAARDDVLCLPLWGAMSPATVSRVCRELRSAQAAVT
jgi:dTDP-4-amino-4,6-dideoxygalactose transaminase